MELDEQLKQKITERFLKGMGEPVSDVIEEIYDDLILGEHTVNVMIRGKYTVAEIKYNRNGYEHHFLGVSAKNPNDDANVTVGIKKAMEDAFGKLLSKFYIEEVCEQMLV